MDWIKKHYDQFALALLGVALLACAIFLYLRTRSFSETFAEASATVQPGEKVPPLVLDKVDEAKSNFAKPAQWNADAQPGSLFVSQPYIVGRDGNPVKPGNTSLYKDSLTDQPIPNSWFIAHSLPITNPNIATLDTDGDGFPNEAEWRANPQTDPNDKSSHPPYYTMLFLKQIIKRPFRLILRSYDGDPKKGNPDTFSFQIDTIDYRQPSEFIKIGDLVPKTKFKVEKFEYKTQFNPKIESDEDVSEVTLKNIETNELVILVLNRVVDSPDTFAVFDYQWALAPIEFPVQRLKEFALKPNINERYKLIDTKDNEALIQLPSGEKYTVTRDPRKK